MNALQIAQLMQVAADLIGQIEVIRSQTQATAAATWHDVTTNYADALAAYDTAVSRTTG